MEESQILIVNFEGGDEIHLSVCNYSTIDVINKFLDSKNTQANADTMLEYIYKNRLEYVLCQSYALEDYLFGKYNIKKIIHVPELGC
jgi:hypothetical protein